ncbi:MAG: hypothetical protein WCF05_13540 [Chromatiaceae bacterium]
MIFDTLTLGGFVLTFVVAGLMIAIERGNEKLSELHRRMRGCGAC